MLAAGAFFVIHPLLGWRGLIVVGAIPAGVSTSSTTSSQRSRSLATPSG